MTSQPKCHGEAEFYHARSTVLVFATACLFSAFLMRLLVREHGAPFTMFFGCASLALGLFCSWFGLRRWRFTSPMRAIVILGISSGISGAALFIVMVQTLGYLFPMYIGPVLRV